MFRRSVIAVAFGLGLMSLAAPPTQADQGDQHLHVLALPYRSDNWYFLDVASGAFPTFPQSSAANGALIQGRAGFGTIGHGCKFNNGFQVKNSWAPGTDLLLEHTVALANLNQTHGTNDYATIIGTVTGGSADIYWDGDLVQHVDSTNDCTRANVKVSVDVGKDENGDSNRFGELVVRASGNGQSVTFADFKVIDYFTQYGCVDCQ